MEVPWACLLHFTFLLFISHFTHTEKQDTCYFPERWEGTWFQSGVRQPIIIEGSKLGDKGRCFSFEGDKFLIVDDKHACYRCVVIHEKHLNVLQYKETYCHERDALPTLCNFITGDALLFSMFRENAIAIPCPFRGYFTFTYNRGYGECRSPVSTINTCTEDTRLLLNYQACPDIHGSESAIEELQCLAVWKEGSSRYLVGKIHHSHATSNEDRFRCFVYERTLLNSEASNNVDYRIAQSGDATCNGLFSATEGSRTMTLKKAPTPNKCRFPLWVTTFNHWHTLDHSATYSFHHRNSTLRITNSSGLEMKVVCVQLKHSTNDESSLVLVTHLTLGCRNGYSCMSFYRRDAHVMEMQIGSLTNRREDACTSPFFDRKKAPFITLVTATPETRACPYFGKFKVKSLIHKEHGNTYTNKYYLQDGAYLDSNHYVNKLIKPTSDTVGYEETNIAHQEIDCDNNKVMDLIFGCNDVDTMKFRSFCFVPDFITSYWCHGKWQENGVNFLITTPVMHSPHNAPRFCFIYQEHSLGLVMFSTSVNTCSRRIQPGVTGELIFNITTIGKCIETNVSSKMEILSAILVLPLIHLILFCPLNFTDILRKIITVTQR